MFTRGDIRFERSEIIERLLSHQYVDKTDTEQFLDYLTPQKVAISGIDAASGSSGGPLFDEGDGVMIGTIYSALRPNAFDTDYYPDSTQVIPFTPEAAQTIKRLVPSNEECGDE